MLCKTCACLGETPNKHEGPESAEAYQAFVQALEEQQTAQRPQSLTHQQVVIEHWHLEQHLHLWRSQLWADL